MKKTITRLALAALSFGFVVPSAQAAYVAAPAKEASAPATEEAAATSAATAEWHSLSRAERRDRVNSAKQAIKEWKTSAASDINKLLLVIITILLPPVGVLIYQGKLDVKFLISLLLTLLFYIPGLIYSLLVIFGQA